MDFLTLQACKMRTCTKRSSTHMSLDLKRTIKEKYCTELSKSGIIWLTVPTTGKTECFNLRPG